MAVSRSRSQTRSGPPESDRHTSRVFTPGTLAAMALGAAFAIYLWLFLRMPLSNAAVDMNGEPVRRAQILLNLLVYPEGLIPSWFGGAHLRSGLFDRLPVVVGAGGWIATAAWIGKPFVNIADPRKALTRIERVACASLVGLALLSTITLCVGLVGGLSSRWPLLSAVIFAAVVVPLAVNWLARRHIRKQVKSTAPIAIEVADQDLVAHESFPTLTVENHWWDRWLMHVAMLLTVAIGSLYILGAILPPFEFDVVEYHLQAPKEFFQQGSIGFVPHNVYANMPLGSEMHTLAAMTMIGQPDAWWGGLIGKCLTGLFSILGACLLGGYLSRVGNKFLGWSAAGLWLAAPGNEQVAMAGLIDSVLATYLMAAAYAIEQARALADTPFNASHPQSPVTTSALRSATLAWWSIAGLCAGAAAATKYPGLIYVVAPVVVYVALLAARERDMKGLSLRTAVLLAALLVTCVPWYAKNWILAGNPVYPLAGQLFGGTTLTPEKIVQWQHAHRTPVAAPADATLIQRASAECQSLASALERMAVSGPQLHPALMFLLVIGLIVGWRHLCLVRRWGIWSLWILAVWWLATHRIDRFWLPTLGLWSAIAVYGLAHIRTHYAIVLGHVVLLTGLLYGFAIAAAGVAGDNRYFASLDSLRRDAGGPDGTPGRVPAMIGGINETLATNASPPTRVLLIGEAKAYLFEVPIVYSTCFDTNPGEAWLRGKSPAEQREQLRAHGITHILVNWSEIQRYRGPGNYGFSDWPQPEDIEQLIERGLASRISDEAQTGAVELLEVQQLDPR